MVPPPDARPGRICRYFPLESEKMRDGSPLSAVVSLANARTIADRRTRLGIMVLTGSMQLLYLNKEARELTMQYSRAEGLAAANGLVPSEMMEVCQELVVLTKEQACAKDCEEVCVKRVIGNGQRLLLLEGVSVPHPTDADEGRIILVIQPVSNRQEGSARQARERFGLTDREETVVVCLTMGLTNKEIALRLGVTEPTVKEHLRHVMQKMKTTTRTGVLAKVLFGDLEPVTSREQSVDEGNDVSPRSGVA